jgi:hypothetical protein
VKIPQNPDSSSYLCISWSNCNLFDFEFNKYCRTFLLFDDRASHEKDGRMKRFMILVISLISGTIMTKAPAASSVNTQRMLVESYLTQSNTFKKCGPVDLEAYDSATFFPSAKEMYIWNAGALGYYVLQNQKAVRRWTAIPVLPTQQYVGPVRQIKAPNTFLRWFTQSHNLKIMEVTKECGALPTETRGGPFYEVRVRGAYRGTLQSDGLVDGHKKVASNVSDPRLYLSAKWSFF